MSKYTKHAAYVRSGNDTIGSVRDMFRGGVPRDADSWVGSAAYYKGMKKLDKLREHITDRGLQFDVETNHASEVGEGVVALSARINGNEACILMVASSGIVKDIRAEVGGGVHTVNVAGVNSRVVADALASVVGAGV